MFRKMRRSGQALPEERIVEVLYRNTSGVLSLLDDNGYTYGVPLSYLLRDGTIYFHGYKSGAKMDAVRHHNKVSFTVIDQDDVVPGEYTTHYRSVIVFGTARILTDPAEIGEAIRGIGRRYNPTAPEERLEKAVADEYAGLGMIALDIEHMTGKESAALRPQG